MKQHALLSASGSHCWLNCTARPRFEERLSQSGGLYVPPAYLAAAKVGTDAHAQAEEWFGKVYSGHHSLTEIEDPHVQFYVSACIGLARQSDTFGVETEVDTSKYIPEGIGTIDFWAEVGDTLWVVDFKYGKIKVNAEDNPQMGIYALGTLEMLKSQKRPAKAQLYIIKRLKHPSEITKIKMCIVQPRINNYSTALAYRKDLEEWGAGELRRKAHEAFEGGRFAVGKWCNFCPCRQQCAAHDMR